MELNRIYYMDCMEGMKEIADGRIDLVVTDPPYRITPRGNPSTSGGLYAKKDGLKGTVFSHNDIDIADYIDELYRVLKENAHCYIMTNNYNICHFLDVVSKSRFHFVKCLIWDKQNKVCGTYYMSQYEYIIFLRKGFDKPINNCGCPDILSVPNVKTKDSSGENIHDSEKPVSLMRILIENSSDRGDVVLDPFMGSGTTAVAASIAGRNFIGFEIDTKYRAECERRLGELENKSKPLF